MYNARPRLNMIQGLVKVNSSHHSMIGNECRNKSKMTKYSVMSLRAVIFPHSFPHILSVYVNISYISKDSSTGHVSPSLIIQSELRCEGNKR